jgi:hypothetical protein
VALSNFFGETEKKERNDKKFRERNEHLKKERSEKKEQREENTK